MPPLSKLLLLTLLGLLGACASQQSLAIRVLRPAPVDLGQFALVAVDRLDGQGCEELTNELADALRGARNPLTGKQDFEVLDRREVDRMLDDLRRRRGTAFDQEAMQLLERWKTADVVIRGAVQAHDFEEEVAAQEWIDPKTGGLRRTFVRTGCARVAVQLEIVQGANEKIVDRVAYEEQETARTSAVDGEPPALDAATLLANARQRVTQRYLDRLLPHEETVAVALQTDGKLPELQAGNGFARAGDWDEAARSYESAAQRATGDLADRRWKAMHNLGLAHLFANRFDAARSALKEAYNLEQDESTLQSLNLAAQREQEMRVLQQQSRTAAPAR
jgi:hypothetical protein